MSKGKTAAETIYFEIADALDLLDNVTAADEGSSSDYLGQAELALTRARDVMAGGALSLFAQAPAMLAALRKAQELLRDLESPAHLDEGAALDDEITAILARIDGTPTDEPAGPIEGES